MNKLIMNPSKLMFMLILMMGTIVTISSNSWPAMWMGLEINMMAFIPLMMLEDNHLPSAESSMKYFIIQSMASSMFLMFIILMYMKMQYIMNDMTSVIQIMMMITLFIKMGAAPFHMWFPNTMEGLSWTNCILLMTWQKIAPMIILSMIQYNNMCMYFSIMSSVVIGSISGLNQTSTRKIMAYSSINHIGWMLLTLLISNMLWMIYFLIYSIISSSMMIMFKNLSNFHFNQMFLTTKINMSSKLLMMLNFMSLGGLPPMLGFIPKWLVIQMSSNQLLIIFMIWISLITLFYYIRLTMSTFMLNNSNLKWNIKTMNNTYMTMPMLMTTSTLGFIIYPTFYLLV
uniref:NADH-ubiquinone oxidoreductase chain 2 n=1 Tax=Cacoplistes rogenhoferi TaxID=2316737 RepID=A0A385I1X5_9ORTH|nr:NADH dehydrogenase subunit 2 [Cacoplistes rogenhoferi]AXY63898.1 NADH dehydrogenase subunit 2 [Cacoplistes rogenhoferi]